MNKDEKLHNIIARFKLTKKEEKEFTDIIYDIYSHNEFQIRMTDKFYHHGTVTLGEHILEDTLITYKKIKKLKSQKKVDLKLALKIAMMHDLYEEAWQNKRKKFNSFFHLHGFRHPIEAAINSAVWYKDEFKDLETAKKINDCIINFRIWNISQNPEAINLLEKEFDVKLDTSVENFTLAPNKFLSKENIFKWPDINDDETSENGYCHALSSQIAILVDGTLVPCCLDNNGDITLGNIYLQELDEIVNSKRAQDMLKGFRNRKVTEELCKKCTYKLQF